MFIKINNLTFQNKKIIKSCPVDYMRVNPLKHEFVKRIADYRIPRFTNMSRKVFIYLVVW